VRRAAGRSSPTCSTSWQGARQPSRCDGLVCAGRCSCVVECV
jgi:hypothetical protein